MKRSAFASCLGRKFVLSLGRLGFDVPGVSQELFTSCSLSKVKQL